MELGINTEGESYRFLGQMTSKEVLYIYTFTLYAVKMVVTLLCQYNDGSRLAQQLDSSHHYHRIVT